ncbi:MAG TPA: hypothetical protein VMW35_18940 [Myxococcota bacterium]|nr:hypothetical protein [Myxococcota bacterium]
MRARLARLARALRDFLRGFLGMPAARLPAGSATCVRHALEERADRRRSCC